VDDWPNVLPIANAAAVPIQCPLETERTPLSWSKRRRPASFNTTVTSLNIQIPLANSPASHLRLQFDQSGDRWRHRWQLVDSTGQTTDVLTSIEGSDQDTFPASSALQEINLHELPTGPALLGVGMAGKGHWSASYSVETSEGQALIKCDMACLLKQLNADGQWLGSTYSIGENVSVNQDGSWVRFSENNLTFGLSADPAFASINVTNQKIEIVPTKFSDSKTVATRWLFSATC